MSILFLSSSGKLHETALSMEIGTKSTLNMHQVDELDPRIGTMLKLYRHHRGGDHLRPKGAISGHNGAKGAKTYKIRTPRKMQNIENTIHFSLHQCRFLQ